MIKLLLSITLNNPLVKLNGMGILIYTALLFCVVPQGIHSDSASGTILRGWSYDMMAHNGPHKWGEFEDSCDGESQSPINIHTKDSTYDESLKGLRFKRGERYADRTMENNGHSGLVLEVIECLYVKIGSSNVFNERWSYHGFLGPSVWPILFPESCDGTMQSPVNIDTEHVAYDKTLSQFKTHFVKVDGINLMLENNGHTVKISFGDGSPLFGKAGLSALYKTAQLHFHWGSRNEKGSEHTIDKRNYPLEMHVVGIKSGYTNLTEALKDPEGLAVLAVLFEIGDYNTGFSEITENLDLIPYHGDTVKLPAITVKKLRSMFPNNIHDYYRYRGSLTTPDCNEVVIWTIFADTVKMSQEQIDAFRKLKSTKKFSKNQEDLVNNFRPPQLLNNRVVSTSIKQTLAAPPPLDIDEIPDNASDNEYQQPPSP